MTACFTILLLLALAVFLTATLLRWFELTAHAVDEHQWHQLTLLLLMPFAAWLFPTRTAAGRPTTVPPHDPVQGFGYSTPAPPPMPSTTPKKSKPPIDPAQVAKLKQKLKDRGMLDDDDPSN